MITPPPTTYSPEQWALAGSTALGAIGTFIGLLYNMRQGRRNGQNIENVHELVNERSHVQENRIEQLSQTIKESNGDSQVGTR